MHRGEFGLSIRSGIVVDEVGLLESLEEANDIDHYIEMTLLESRRHHKHLHDFVQARRAGMQDSTAYGLGFSLVYQIIWCSFQDSNQFISLSQGDMALQSKTNVILDDALEPLDREETMAFIFDHIGPLSQLLAYVDDISGELSESLYSLFAKTTSKNELQDTIRGISDAFLPFYTKWTQHNHTSQLLHDARYHRN